MPDNKVLTPEDIKELAPLYEAVVLAIKQVYDPEIPVNVYDLGLIYELNINKDHDVYIKMTFTAPNCPMADEVLAEVAFDKVDLLDNQEDGKLGGEVHFLLYKGDHYHLTILTDDGDHLWVDTDDIWDKGDLVGIDILPSDIKIKRKNG